MHRRITNLIEIKMQTKIKLYFNILFFTDQRNSCLTFELSIFILKLSFKIKTQQASRTDYFKVDNRENLSIKLMHRWRVLPVLLRRLVGRWWWRILGRRVGGGRSRLVISTGIATGSVLHRRWWRRRRCRVTTSIWCDSPSLPQKLKSVKTEWNKKC